MYVGSIIIRYENKGQLSDNKKKTRCTTVAREYISLK